MWATHKEQNNGKQAETIKIITEIASCFISTAKN